MKLNVRHVPHWTAAVAAFLAATAQAAAAQQLPEGVTEVASVEGITEYRLDNGLRFLLFPDQSKQQITVNVTYMVGSRHEGYGETGMAHLLEHLVFKGTPDHPNIPDELTERGAFPNGTTWFDRTNYFETFPASDENLAWAIDLEADRMVNSFIAEEDLESEMTVVRNEWESGENQPVAVLQKRVMSAAYDWHNYGNSTIGARADLENVPIERLQAFYRKYYQPDNALVVIAGRFDPEYAIQLVAEEFGAIPRPDRTGANELFDTYTAEPAQDGERTVTLRRVGDVQMVMAAYHVPPGSHEQYAAVDVLIHVLATRPAGRLYQNLVETGLAANAFSFGYQLNEPGVMMAAAQVRQEDSLEEAAAAMLATLDEMVEAPPTEEEVERARTDYLSGIELAFNNPQGIALQLSEWASMGDWRLFFLHRDRLEQVTPTAVHQVAQAYLKPSNRTIGYFYPTEETPARAEIPEPPDVAALVANYTGREAVAEGEAFDPTPANIDERTVTTTLANGVEVSLLRKENRGDAVSVQFSFRHGTEAALMGRATAGSLAGSMLMRGTTERSRQEISDELDRLRAQGSVSGSALSAGGSFTTVRENLAAVSGWPARCCANPPSIPTNSTCCAKRRLAAIEQQQSEPQALVFEAFNRHLNQYPEDHPRYSTTFEEDIERLNAATVDEARAFWSDFYGAEGGTIAVVGDFDADETLAVLEEVFGDWEAPEPYERVPDPYVEVGDRERGHRDPRQGQRVDGGRHRLPHARRRSPLSGAAHGRLHAGRRVPEFASADPHPPGGGALLRRGLAIGGAPGRRRRAVPYLRHLRPRERRPGGGRVPRRAAQGAGGRVHPGGTGCRETRVPGRAAERPLERRRAGRPAQQQPVHQPDHGVHRRPGSGHRSADAGGGQLRAARLRFAGRHLHLPRGRLRQQADPVGDISGDSGPTGRGRKAPARFRARRGERTI